MIIVFFMQKIGLRYLKRRSFGIYIIGITSKVQVCTRFLLCRHILNLRSKVVNLRRRSALLS